MRFIHEYSSRWLDFVKYFSHVNDQRIEGERKYMESNMIGEEIMTLDIGLGNEEKDHENLPKFDDEQPINKSKVPEERRNPDEQPLLRDHYDASEVAKGLEEKEEEEK